MLKRGLKGGQIFLVIGMLLIAAGAWLWYDIGSLARRFAAEGIETEARITSLVRTQRVTSTGGAVRQTTPSFKATVSYSSGNALDGSLEIHFESRPISREFYDTHREGQAVTVRYLPDAPDKVEIDQGWTENNAIYAAATLGGFAVMFLLLAWLMMRMAKADRTLFTEGIRAKGELQRIVQVQSLALLEFSFTTPDGQGHTARSKPSKDWKHSTLQPGAPLEIIYLPNAPEKARLLSDVAP